jgi:hypothetical protein
LEGLARLERRAMGERGSATAVGIIRNYRDIVEKVTLDDSMMGHCPQLSGTLI